MLTEYDQIIKHLHVMAMALHTTITSFCVKYAKINIWETEHDSFNFLCACGF